MKDKVILIYRKPRRERKSIEKLFKPFNNLKQVEPIYLPYDLNSFLNFFRLLWFSFTVKEKYIHITGDVYFMALFWCRKKIILTVHDAYHYTSLKGIKRWVYGWIWLKIPFKIASRIAVISPETKLFLQEHFKVKSEKFELIPNYSSIEKKDSILHKKNKILNILTVGTKKNKNLIRLFEAVKDLEKLHLTIIGELSYQQLNLLEKYKISYTNLIDLSDKELEKKYREADALYFVSIQEGFGLPIIEAQNLGTFVMTSNKPPMDYVAGKGAILLNPYSIEEIENTIKLLSSGLLPTLDYIREGFKNVERFEYTSFQNAYLKLYESL